VDDTKKDLASKSVANSQKSCFVFSADFDTVPQSFSFYKCWKFY